MRFLRPRQLVAGVCSGKCCQHHKVKFRRHIDKVRGLAGDVNSGIDDDVLFSDGRPGPCRYMLI